MSALDPHIVMDVRRKREIAIDQRRQRQARLRWRRDLQRGRDAELEFDGGTIKFQLGITAPLEITTPSQARLALPALVDRNFSFAPDIHHDVWIESRHHDRERLV